MHAAAVTSSIMHTVIHLLLSKFHLAPGKNFKLSCVQLMISSGSPLNVLHFSSSLKLGGGGGTMPPKVQVRGHPPVEPPLV